MDLHISQKKMVCIDYPGIVQNHDAMLQTLGGAAKVSNVWCYMLCVCPNVHVSKMLLLWNGIALHIIRIDQTWSQGHNMQGQGPDLQGQGLNSRGQGGLSKQILGNRQRNDFYLPGCLVWMFITVYDVIYLRCLISNK